MKITISNENETLVTYDSTTHPRIGEVVTVVLNPMSFHEGVVSSVETQIVKGIAEVFVKIE